MKKIFEDKMRSENHVSGKIFSLSSVFSNLTLLFLFAKILHPIVQRPKAEPNLTHSAYSWPFAIYLCLCLQTEAGEEGRNIILHLSALIRTAMTSDDKIFPIIKYNDAFFQLGRKIMRAVFFVTSRRALDI